MAVQAIVLILVLAMIMSLTLGAMRWQGLSPCPWNEVVTAGPGLAGSAWQKPAQLYVLCLCMPVC